MLLRFLQDGSQKDCSELIFADELIPLMIAVALAESSGLPYTHNRNQFTGDDSYGLFQINMIDEIGVERR